MSLGHIVTIIVLVVLAVLVFLLQLQRNELATELPEQHHGERWSLSGTRSGQASVYFNESSGITRDKIREFDYKMNQGITRAGFQGSEALPEDDNTVWGSCYSAAGMLTVANGRRSVSTLAYGVGGDFFQFHPMELAGGYLFDGTAVMKDYVVLDENLAWQLFGSNDISGKTVEINGIPHLITGVVRVGTNRFYKAAGMNKTVIFTSFETLATYGTIDNTAITSAAASSKDASTDASSSKSKDSDSGNEVVGVASDVAEGVGGITCYEVVMPSPVDGYVPSFVIETLGFDVENVEVMDNSSRFGNRHLLSVLGHYSTRSMQFKAVVYPYWENAARAVEDISALILVLQMICILIIVILLLIVIVQWYRHKKWTIESAWQGFKDWQYDVSANMKKQHEKWKYF